MNWIRRSVWLFALLPVLAAITYVGFAARFPEPVAARAALHEPAAVWSLENWLDVTDEPLQPLRHALLLGPLQLPGMSLQAAAGLAVVFALAIVCLLTRLVRRSAAADSLGTALAFGCIAALVCSPAFGSVWLYAERGAVFVPLLLLAGSLALLQLERGLLWRLLAVVLLVAAAPFCHDTGVLVGLAVLPAVYAAAARAGGGRWTWVAVVAAFGLVAGGVSFWPAGGLHGDDAGLFGHLAAEPGARLLDMLAAIGASWLDLWPERRVDELVLGGATVLLLCGMPFLAPRQDASSAAPWWSCALFGVLLVPWVAARHGFELAPWLARELHCGSFLLPIGCIGILATRFGAHAFSVGLGVLATLSLQDWPRGLEALRAAHAESVRVEASLAVPSQFTDHRTQGLAPFATEAQRERLLARGWSPDPTFDLQAAAVAAQASPPSDQLGSVTAGSPIEMHGMVRSSIVNEQIGAVVVAAIDGDTLRLLGVNFPQFAGRGRDAQWRVSWSDAAPEGTQLVAFGFVPRHSRFVRIGVARLVKDGALVVTGP